jgi:signal transduction histidine kinase
MSAQHCSGVYAWRSPEVSLLQQVVLQLGLAIGQSELGSGGQASGQSPNGLKVKRRSLDSVKSDLSDRQRIEAILRQRAEREHLLRTVNQHIRRSLDLETVLATTVAEVQRTLKADRALIFRLHSDRSGQIIQESVVSPYFVTNQMRWPDECFPDECYQYYQRGKPRIVANVATDEWTACLADFMQTAGVQSKMVAPILHGSNVPGNRLWGLLIVHACTERRAWELSEAALLQQIADQLAIAIQQAELYRQVQQLNTQLEQQVLERTQTLQQSLDFEATLKRITDAVRDSLDETQILQTAVRELALALKVECCETALYDSDRTLATICCDYTVSIPSAQGQVIPIDLDSPLYQDLLDGAVLQFCPLVNNEQMIREVLGQAAILACPLRDDQGVMGDIWLFKPCSEYFDELEIRLVQQVANQCAIALRQSQLYQSAQAQVCELERLNQLKDDFLSTVSHELRTPMANIKMATQMLNIHLQRLELLADASTPIHRYFHILQDECQREIDLINDLLDLARLDADTEPPTLSPVCLNNLILQIAEPFKERAQQRQQRFNVKLLKKSLTFPTDLAYLERILTELLNNACKYTPPGETITLSAQIIGASIELCVCNSGVEIAEPERDRIFDRFYRIPNGDPWKHGGTGLGLALVKKLVEKLDGTITLKSGQGQTVFAVQLALTDSR